MDADHLTTLPAEAIEDGSLVEQLSDPHLRRLTRTAAGLSVESQRYLAELAGTLRVTEGLSATGCEETSVDEA